VATVLAYTDYDRVAAGFGGQGIRLADPEMVEDVLTAAHRATQDGQPVLINAILADSDFRKGSLSM
jgi:acetolactate synthase-1/2/3 large subunit